MSRQVKARYMPCLLCPECGCPMHWEEAPQDHPHESVRVLCTEPGCPLAGQVFEPEWPEITLHKVEAEVGE